MATLASTNITTAIPSGTVGPLSFGEGGLILEVFRIPGGTAGDTCALTPSWIADIRTIVNPANFGHTLSSTSVNSAVTITAGTGVNTSLTYDVHVIGRRRST